MIGNIEPEFITLFMADGPQRCTYTPFAPCITCGGAKFALTSMATGKLWNCYTCQCDKREEAQPKRHSNVIRLAEYKAKKANVPKKG